MSVVMKAIVHVAWDEVGGVAASSEAADQLDQQSAGRFRRVLALRLTLPAEPPIEMTLNAADPDAMPTARRA
jgi:hypothetical protein